ncbi:MAG TPA: RNA polymerase sigma-70 factor [Acidothermaceae bacterium]|jgi:RNA polymerase sigma-70 factor (ECF subfamily)
MSDDDELARTYTELRPLLFSIAYRMLGSVSDAEDVVQESFVRYRRAIDDGVVVDSTRPYLASIASRLSLDHLKSARVQRETYVGMWLPEPLLTDPMPDVSAHAEIADSLSTAFLVLLETLSPTERAVFLLRDVFAYEFDEIASVVGKSTENCRQLLVRARKHIDERRPRYEASREQKRELADRFFAAVESGDVAGLQAMLAADVTFTGDGGGKAPAAARAIVGIDKVGRFMVALVAFGAEMGMVLTALDINDEPGMMFTTHDGLVLGVLSLDIADGQVQALHAVVNPDKLQHLGPVGDLRTLVEETRVRGGEPPQT